MRNVKLGLLFVLVAMSQAAMGSKFLGEVNVPLTKAFIPYGFDTDDSVEIVVTGEFPNSCFKMGPIETRVDANQVVHLIASAFEFKGKCVKGPMPFSQVISLGRLREEGSYRVVDGTSHQELGKIKVEVAGSMGHGTDEVLYAPLTDAFLLNEGGSQSLRLVGAFPNDCMEFVGVKIQLFEDVLVALPEVRERDGECVQGNFPFHREEPLSIELPHGNYLLHVRSMNGRAINKLMVSHP